MQHDPQKFIDGSMTAEEYEDQYYARINRAIDQTLALRDSQPLQ